MPARIPPLLLLLAVLSRSLFAAELDGELRDAAARIEYGWLTRDAGLIASARSELAGRSSGPWQSYLVAYAAWREAALRESAGHAVGNLPDICEQAAEAAAEAAEAAAESAILIAACAALAAADEPLRGVWHQRRFRQAYARAASLDARNPRLMLVALRYAAGAADVPRIEPADVVAAFRERRDEHGFPDWGEAEALALAGERRLEAGDLRGARDLLEEALLFAPGYTIALDLKRRVLELAAAN